MKFFKTPQRSRRETLGNISPAGTKGHEETPEPDRAVLLRGGSDAERAATPQNHSFPTQESVFDKTARPGSAPVRTAPLRRGERTTQMPNAARVPSPLPGRSTRGPDGALRPHSATQRPSGEAPSPLATAAGRSAPRTSASPASVRGGAALPQPNAGRGPPRPHGRNLPLFFPTLRDSGGRSEDRSPRADEAGSAASPAERTAECPHGRSPHSGSAPGPRTAEGQRGTPCGAAALRARPRGTHSPAGRRDGAGAAAAVYAPRAGAALFLLSGPEPPDVSAVFAYSTQSAAPVRDGGTAPSGHAGMGTVGREGPVGGHRERTAGPHRRGAKGCGAVPGRHTWSTGGGVPPRGDAAARSWQDARGSAGEGGASPKPGGIQGIVRASWIGKVLGCSV